MLLNRPDMAPLPVAHRRRIVLPRWAPVLAIVLGVHLLLLLAWSCRPGGGQRPPERPPDETTESPAETNEVTWALRPAPKTFPRNTYMPDQREGVASGSIHMPTFSAGRDLMYIDDERVWWESDHDGEHDDECDHTIHFMLEAPLKRLIEMVAARDARLKVQDAFRPTGIHNPRSLHREGRAIDLTSEGMSLEELAKLCWQAGFDWVYFECPSGGGDHIHASVKRAPEQTSLKANPE